MGRPGGAEWGRALGGLSDGARFVLGVSAMLCFGLASAQLPGLDRSLAQVANMSAPWVVAPMLVGRAQRSLLPAALTATAANVAGIAAFYLNVFPRLDATYLGLPSVSPPSSVVSAAFVMWLAAHSEWFAIAAGTGLVAGALGYWWRASGARVLGALVAIPFLLEPAFALLTGTSGVFWMGEFALGSTLLVGILFAPAHATEEPARGSA